jgi:serine/threonine protein kinase
MLTDLGPCEWFVWDLRHSKLVAEGPLNSAVEAFLAQNPGAEPDALAAHLVRAGILTEFQAERLLTGKNREFVVGPFTLSDALGSGSLGTVYKAQSKTDHQWYAVKVLPRRSMWNMRIARRKVTAFEQCSHPAVVRFAAAGTSGGMHYFAWPVVAGETLDRVVQREGKLGPARAAALGIQIAEGLDDAHRAGLFHGLLKPPNLMIAPDGTVRILDFGLGCLLAETEDESLVDTMSTANAINSGLDCASPESIMDPTNLNAVGDQYSLGCVLYFCLTGRYPFPDGSAIEKMMGHQMKQPTPVADLTPGLPAGLVAVVERLMSKGPAERYADCAEVIEALRPFAAGAAPEPARAEPQRAPEVVSLPASEPAPPPEVRPLQVSVSVAVPEVLSRPVSELLAAVPPAPLPPQPVMPPAPAAHREPPVAEAPAPPVPAPPPVIELTPKTHDQTPVLLPRTIALEESEPAPAHGGANEVLRTLLVALCALLAFAAAWACSSFLF